jgi:hypothetical protein
MESHKYDFGHTHMKVLQINSDYMYFSSHESS